MRSPSSFFPVAVAVALTLGRVAVAVADTCPEIPAEESGLRRSMAKEWFAKAEESEAGGDKPAAVRRYACSLNLTPHPSTAYNLGTVAEKSGDWSMAIEGFRAYLKLSPEAPDRPTIEARVVALEAKLAELRKDLTAKNATANATNTPAPSTVPGPPAPPLPVATALPPLFPPPPANASAHGRHVAGWILLVAAATTAGTGLALNLVARSKVDECYRQWGATAEAAALDRCDEAKPFAYGSYALFAAGGALGAASLLMLLWPSGGTSDEAAPPETEVSFVPSRGGGAAVVSGRF